ncbi:hypothetical protein IGI04_015056, partial [Brassica rapa subsp. trilocularis]
PSCLERSIRKEKRIDTTSTSSIDTCDRATINTSTRASMYTNPRADNMVATLVLTRNGNVDLHDHASPGGPYSEDGIYDGTSPGNSAEDEYILNLRLAFSYKELNRKVEALDAHVMMLDTQVFETAETVKKQEVLVKGKVEETKRHQERKESRVIQNSPIDTCILPSHIELKRTTSIDINTMESIDNNRRAPINSSRRAAIDTLP